uniref:Uncharacterized protein n=1 Tax=Rangifer tarandus platyrhynchus TaxID=3082113 RepID=A0ACB0E6Y3_RANTA|nr:unnamed protein product [Rangifer tarandus platyrhynchus]
MGAPLPGGPRAQLPATSWPRCRDPDASNVRSVSVSRRAGSLAPGTLADGSAASCGEKLWPRESRPRVQACGGLAGPDPALPRGPGSCASRRLTASEKHFASC